MKTMKTAELWTVILLAHEIQSSCSSSSARQSTKIAISRLAEKILTLQNCVKRKKEKSNCLICENKPTEVLEKQSKAKTLLFYF